MLSNIQSSITLSIIVVLMYILFDTVLRKYLSPDVGSENAEWYKSMEVVLLVIVFVSFHVNQMIFNY
jgi:hypothetical protein